VSYISYLVVWIYLYYKFVFNLNFPMDTVLIWLVPVVIHIGIIRRVPVFEFVGLHPFSLRALAYGIAFATSLLTAALLGHEPAYLNVAPAGTWLVTVMMPGVFEEVFFRGYLLNTFMQTSPFWISNLTVTALFVGIHIPVWIGDGITTILGHAMYTLVLSLIMGYVNFRSKSLMPSIIIHWANNSAALLLISLL